MLKSYYLILEIILKFAFFLNNPFEVCKKSLFKYLLAQSTLYIRFRSMKPKDVLKKQKIYLNLIIFLIIIDS